MAKKTLAEAIEEGRIARARAIPTKVVYLTCADCSTQLNCAIDAKKVNAFPRIFCAACVREAEIRREGILLSAKQKEICFECGKSVKLGSGKFVNRVPSLDNTKTRKANGAKYPQGEFICEECDEKEA